MRVSYRVRQLWRAVTAKELSPSERAEIQAALSPAEYQLFLSYEMTDQRHCYGVMTTLREHEAGDPDLLAAALLHDIGKTQVTLSSVDRIVGTLAERSWQGSLDRWGHDAPQGWHRPFAVRAQHAEWGAALAEGVGSRPRVVELIRRHQDSCYDGLTADDAKLLRLLQWADEQN